MHPFTRNKGDLEIITWNEKCAYPGCGIVFGEHPLPVYEEKTMLKARFRGINFAYPDGAPHKRIFLEFELLTKQGISAGTDNLDRAVNSAMRLLGSEVDIISESETLDGNPVRCAEGTTFEIGKDFVNACFPDGSVLRLAIVN